MKKGYELNVGQVRELALEKGLSERQLLKQAKCSYSLMSNARKGKRIMPQTIARLAEVLDCYPSDLVMVGDVYAENENN